MYYQQYNGPLNYELDSSNGLIPLEHNDYPLISVVVGPSPSIPGTLTATTQSLTTYWYSHTPVTAISTNMGIPSTTLLQSTSSSLTSSSTQTQSINNTLHITNTPSQSSNTLPPTLLVTSSTAVTTITITTTTDMNVSSTTSLQSTSSSSLMTSSPTLMTPTSINNTCTENNTLIIILLAVLSTVFILLVVTILVILIVSVLVCRRIWYKTSIGNDSVSSTESKADIHQQSDAIKMNEGQNTFTASTNPAYRVTGQSKMDYKTIHTLSLMTFINRLWYLC
ncbi:PREDICTED: cell wall integrity and stress response component 4-like [Amphimedon queenslandica]|uniref:Uncharacterized protein n=1 Tax=Amphimedon queenslandica TaxID=400682 RepID=A0AAN0JR13_AMPQE|nr:PREDICTED: cell wall integrity and stress response component 4-like [Amphimedon queenslandica]|eukprot:XP_019859275.1 PREDICTED: cell wall integrity and stress response component 4-like [Amphimedon queenslandica]